MSEFILTGEKISAITRSLLLVISTVILITIGAWIRIPLPFTPVPFTLQVFSVLLIANIRRWEGLAGVGLYTILGMMGLPLFSGFGFGIGHIIGPTGGYILGFPLAIIVMRYVFAAEKSFFAILLRSIVGVVVIYLTGLIHLTLLYTQSLSQSLLMGIYPFIIGDLVKAIVVAGIYFKLERTFKLY